jgi:hypothetical protein
MTDELSPKPPGPVLGRSFEKARPHREKLRAVAARRFSGDGRGHFRTRPGRDHAGRGGDYRGWSTPLCGRSKQPRRTALVSICCRFCGRAMTMKMIPRMIPMKEIMKKLANMKKLMVAIRSGTNLTPGTRPFLSHALVVGTKPMTPVITPLVEIASSLRSSQ